MKQWVKYTLRVVVALIFLFSAITKLISIDTFELYIFGFELFSLSLSYLLARVVIAIELALGVALIANIASKLTHIATLLMIIAFTIFLAILALTGNKDNCNCFGEFVNLNPIQSICKNLALIGLLIFSTNLKSFKVKYRSLWLSLIGVASLSAVFILSPPDNWRYSEYNRHTTLNSEAFTQAIETELLPKEITEGEKVVCFYSMRCEFCRMSAQKIATLRKRGDFSQAEIISIIGRGDDPIDPEIFFKETKLDCSKYYYIEPSDFLKITNGSMPLILVMKDGEVISKYQYRDIH